ncbi:BspA family leucine-rich repeat surface protein [Candidatus Spongiihabitans sp.]|uniref:BspA family leucine-rich repeat surface protein n=1 Tax=Candidatus Spongiihabitans sp. TaxID=3101308 RepID=UPI003C6F2D50
MLTTHNNQTSSAITTEHTPFPWAPDQCARRTIINPHSPCAPARARLVLRSNLTQACRRLVALLGGVLLLGLAAQAQAEFITTWRVPTDDLRITFPGKGNYDMNWGDNTFSTITTTNGGGINQRFSHSGYGGAGDYDITTSNGMTRFYLNRGADREKLIDIKQWGGARWSSMERAFYGAYNMRMSATDAPDLSAVSTMADMFREASVFNGAIGTWDVGNVTDMAGMFNGAAAFNRDIGGWDVGNVTGMAGMFSGAAAFDQNIGTWDVGNVTNMQNMFGGSAFNQDIGR